MTTTEPTPEAVEEFWPDRADHDAINRCMRVAADAFDLAYHQSGRTAELLTNVKATIAALSEVLTTVAAAEVAPEAVEELTRVVLPAMPNHCCPPEDLTDCPYDAHEADGIARAVLGAGYVHLMTHLNNLTASERLELGDALCREAAAMDDEENIDDTDLCEHGLRFGCEVCE